jgi:hypothetical protein
MTLRFKIYSLSLLTIILISSSSVFCQDKFTISGKILSRQGNSLVGVGGVDVYIERLQDGVLVGKGQSSSDGGYRVSFEKCEMINATYGNGLYLPELVPSLSGETNHDLTKVLVKNGSKVKLTTQQSTTIISTIGHIQNNSKIFELDLRRLGMTLDESMFPNVLDQQVANLRLTSLIQEWGFASSMTPLSFTGTVVSQSTQDFTVQKSNGEVFTVGFLNSARCGYFGSTLTKCGSDGLVPKLTGRTVVVDAMVNSANGLAFADRVKFSGVTNN